MTGATYATVEPDYNLLLGIRVRGRLEPEVHLVIAVKLLVVNGQATSVGFSNIEVYIGNTSSIDGEFYYC